MLTTPQLIALNSLPGITSAAVRRLVETGEDFQTIVNAPPEDLAAEGLRSAAIAGMANMELLLRQAESQVQRAAQFGGGIIHFWSDDYPARLRQIYAPPIILYLHGTLLPEDDRSIAIVGTRAATMYGRLSAEKYAEEFCASGVTVVSGLARGIDQYAHAAALRTSGRTIAVIASGLDEISPSLSAQMARKIAERGVVISEYPFGVKAIPAYFPQRNRIISGMTAATVVVESDQKGGAMITASFALDQSREVFALPGPISSPKSRGTNGLIRTDRARLTQSPVDVLDALGYHIPTAAANNFSSEPPADLTLFERAIFDSLDGEPRHVDTLCESTGLTSSEALVALLALEFKGLARQMAGKMFLRR